MPALPPLSGRRRRLLQSSGAFIAALHSIDRFTIEGVRGSMPGGESRPTASRYPTTPPPSAAPLLDEEGRVPMVVIPGPLSVAARSVGARIGLPYTLGIRFNALLVTPADDSQVSDRFSRNGSYMRTPFRFFVIGLGIVLATPVWAQVESTQPTTSAPNTA